MKKGKKQQIKLSPVRPAPVAEPQTAPPVVKPTPQTAPAPSTQSTKTVQAAKVDAAPRTFDYQSWLWPGASAVAAIAVFANTLRGEFVYDDKRQIVRNLLIQDLGNFWTALKSDVWAFKAEAGAGAVSNYWRPSFVFWMIANFQLFGLSATGWHIVNVLMHAGVSVLIYFLLRRLDLSALAAGATALLFAVHPAHTESVAWISGAPDLLMALGVLGSLWFVGAIAGSRQQAAGSRQIAGSRQQAAGSIASSKQQTVVSGQKSVASGQWAANSKSVLSGRTIRAWAFALLLCALALGAKEAAILYPLVVFAWLWQPPDTSATETNAANNTKSKSWDWKTAARWAAPFAVLSVVYFFIRLAVIGQLTQEQPDAPSFVEMVLSWPQIFCFYLRQSLFPVIIGPAYPLRPVTVGTLGVGNFFAPLLISVVALAGLLWLAKRNALSRLGLAIFLFFLAPAFNIAAFPREQAVHDRYLYLPLLGLLILLVPPAVEWLQSRAQMAAYVLLGATCLLLGVQTVRYNRAWLSGTALFERAVQADPTSALNYDSLAAVYTDAKRWDDALNAYNQALALKRLPTSLIGRAQTLTELQRYDEAERDLQEVIQGRAGSVGAYTLYQTYERLAICYERQNKLEAGVKALEEARKRLPPYAAALSEKMAVLLYRAGNKAGALAQLEAARPYARRELLPESRTVFFRLGSLYAEANKPAEARAALQEYLALTNNMTDGVTLQQRQQAAALLQKLP